MTSDRPASLPRLDRHAGASRGGQPQPIPYPDLHATAARLDGLVKILVGLVLIALSLSLAIAFVIGLHLLLRGGPFKLWAFVIGVPGLALTLVGAGLMVWGAAKLLSGRGRG